MHELAKQIADNCRPRSTLQYVVEDAIRTYIEEQGSGAVPNISISGKARDTAGRDIKKGNRKTKMIAKID